MKPFTYENYRKRVLIYPKSDHCVVCFLNKFTGKHIHTKFANIEAATIMAKNWCEESESKEASLSEEVL